MDSEVKMTENEMEVDSDSSSNDSNSPEALSDDDEVVDEKAIEEIQEQVKSNPYAYEPHVKLITLVRKIGDLDRLRVAREEMNKIFPLSPELWLDWLTDEQKIATTEEEKSALIALFERAVKDYPSVSLWLEYVQFIIGQMGNEDGMETVRSTFERALSAVGIHVVQGSLIWDTFREFEYALLKTMEASSDGSEEQADKMKEQKKRVYNLFRRQLSVPLMYMDKTYKEFKEEFPDEKDHSLEQMYKKAEKKLKSLMQYEDALYQSESPHLEEYRQYIKHELEEGDPVRVQSIYERALIENCLVPDLWVEYTKYLDHVIKIESIALTAHERAVRNCPWSCQCWKKYALALERHSQPHNTVIDCFEKALNSGFTTGEEFREIWLAYLDYLRRRIKPDQNIEAEMKDLTAVFERAVEHLTTYFQESDEACLVMQYWAKVEASYFKNIPRAREIWNEIMNHGHHGEAAMWLNYANFERIFGDEKHYRKVLLKGLHNASDWTENIGNVLLTFEREEGNLENLDIATTKYESQMKRVEEKRLKLQEKETKLQEQKEVEKQAKKQKNPAKKDVHMDSEGFKIPPPPSPAQLSAESGRVPPLPDAHRKRSANEEEHKESKRQKVEPEHGVSVKHDPSKDNQSVFLSNLSYTVKEEQIRELFSKVGEILEVRLAKDYKGRSKGFGYVVFSSVDEAQSALKMDRERLDGRPAFVSRCEDKKSSASNEAKFRFNTGLEKNKLFIKGLPFTTTEKDLTEIFKEFGELKEVRLVTYRNGHSKGLAYVEFNNEASAASALVKTDGSKIGEQVISVAISNPPQRKTKSEAYPVASISSSLGGGGSSSAGPRGRGRTQLTLLPRALQRPSTQTKSSIQNGSSNGSEESSDSKNLGNDDFRRMFLKK